MGLRWFIVGTVGYIICTLFLFPIVFGIPESLLYSSDDLFYSNAAINLLRSGLYSIDGVNAYIEREPGQSVLLAMVYWLFGIQTHAGLYFVQSVLLFGTALMFSETLGSQTNRRVAGLSFVLLLTSGSVLHSVFSAYRECLTLILLLIFTTLYISSRERISTVTALLMGIILGCLILTYYSFVLLPIVLIPLWLLDRLPRRHLVITLLVTGIVVFGWAFRNYHIDNQFRVVEGQRANVMWFIRGIQAKEVRGLEPIQCLWSEYVSRDWTGRSPSCSFNAVMHRYWPSGFRENPDTSEAGKQGKTMILQNFGSYVWFSVVDILELHMPYVGGGWSTRFNIFAAATQLIIYLGCLLALSKILDPRYRILLLLALYNTGVFILTDATPRYLVPTLFCYVTFAAVGYDSTLRKLSL